MFTGIISTPLFLIFGHFEMLQQQRLHDSETCETITELFIVLENCLGAILGKSSWIRNMRTALHIHPVC